MARIVLNVCDLHLRNLQEQVEATHEDIVTFGSAKARLLTTCEDCYKEHVAPFRELLMEHGEIAESPPATKNRPRGSDDAQGSLLDEDQGPLPMQRRKAPCPFCTYESARSNMRRHLENEHHTSLAVEEGKRGETLTGEKLHFFCRADECQAGFTHRQGRSAHERSEHALNIKDSDEPAA